MIGSTQANTSEIINTFKFYGFNPTDSGGGAETRDLGMMILSFDVSATVPAQVASDDGAR